MRRPLGCLVLLLLAGPAAADKAKGGGKPPKAPPAAQAADTGDIDMPTERTLAPTPRVTHKEGEYGGVIPGQKPEGKTKRAPSKGTLSWIGFEAKDGGAQVFFQSPGPFEVTQHVEGSTLVVHLMLKRLGANTWRQVDTRYFDNPLSGIHAKAVGAARATKTSPAHPAGVQVRITFKNPKDAREATVATKTEADGMSYTYLTFPQGTPVEGGAATTPTTAPNGGDVEN